MPGKHRADLEMISVLIPRRLKVRLQRTSERLDMSMSQLITQVLTSSVAGEELTAVDMAAILAATLEAEATKKHVATKIVPKVPPRKKGMHETDK